jgi:hypothetical protein
LPSRTIDYSDIIDIGFTLIRTKKGNIAIGYINNSEELIVKLNNLIIEGKINKDQIENKLVIEELSVLKAFLPASILSLILWFVIITIWPFEDSLLRDLSFVLIFIPICVVVYKFINNKAKLE